MSAPSALLVTVTGPDQPGVTSRVCAALAGAGAALTDVEQVVIAGQLLLSLEAVLAAGAVSGVRESLEDLGLDLGMRVRVRVLADVPDLPTEPVASCRVAPARPLRTHVTLLGRPLGAAALGSAATSVAACGGNIDRIDRLADYPVTCLQLQVSGCAPDRLRAALTAAAPESGYDVAVQAAGLERLATRLVVLDVDSTLVQGEVIELLAAEAGCAEEVERVTSAAMGGELDFEASLRARVALLEGLPEAALTTVRDGLALTPGARTLVRTLQRLGSRVGIVSGGFTQVTDGLVAELGLDYSAANTLEIVDGVLTGGLVGPVIDRAAKADALRRFAALAGVPLSATVAVGDGANDLDMIAAAGLGVAFNAKPVLRAAADTAVSAPYLDSVLYLLGIRRDDIEAADAAGA